MRHDPELVAETRSWLVKSGQDLRMARLAADASPPMFSQSVYHSQQAAEKAIKGFLTWHSNIFGKTHNLIELGKDCVRIDASLELVMLRAGPLTDYSWRFRYPGERDEPTESQTREAIATADETLKAILSRLPTETHP